MTKHLLAGVATVVLMSSVASAQTFSPYPPAPPPMPVAPPAPVPLSGSSTSTTTTTTVDPSPGGDYRATTIKKGVDAEGKEITKKDTYREGSADSTESHTRTSTDPTDGTTTRSTTTTSTPR